MIDTVYITSIKDRSAFPMALCKARTRNGYHCSIFAQPGSAFCHRHADELDWAKLIGAGIGMFAGNAVLPGLGGKVVGGLAGHVATGLLRDAIHVRKRGFVSFDFDRDRGLKDLFVGQARNEDTPFDIVDFSLKEAAPERNWQSKARTAILRSDVVLVLLGENTWRAQGVLKEVAIAREAGKQVFQIVGYRDRYCPAVPGAGRRLEWSWTNLKKVLS